MTLHIQPESNALSRSPMLYLVEDTLASTETGAQYIARVYIWEDLYTPRPVTYRELKRLPNLSFSAMFNVYTIAKSYFTNNIELLDGFTPFESKTLIYNIQVDFFFKSDTTTPDYDVPDAQSNVIQFTSGYSYASEGVNAKSPNNVFLTARPTSSNIPSDAFFLMAFNYSASSMIKTVHVESNLGATFLYDIETSVGTLDSAEQNMIHVYAGGDVTQYGFPKLGTTWYYLQGRGTGGVTEITDKYYFYITEPCKWGYSNIAFLNKYGAWDFVQFWARKDTSYKITSEEYEQVGVSVSDETITPYPDGQFRQTNISGRDSVVMNTGFVNEEMSEVVKQLYLSEIRRNADTGQPVTMKPAGETYKVHPNERLINYAVMFESSCSITNTMG